MSKDGIPMPQTDPNYANPSTVGLLGFGMTTVLLSFSNTGKFQPANAIASMAIFYGGIAQLIAGIMEYYKGNTFGMTAFCAYGAFWMTLAGIWYLPTNDAVQAVDGNFMGVFMLLWGIFTLFMFIGTLCLNRALQVVFGTLTVVFILLAISNFAESPNTEHAAGWVGLICGFTAMYTGMAELVNGTHGTVLMPIFPME